MEPDEYELMYRVEDRHWWYRGMEAVTRTLLDRRYSSERGLQILDAGCGTGAAMTTYLAEYGSVTGIDLSPIALEYCRWRKAGRLGQASVSALPFRSGSFDLVTSFDVLYEEGVKDDRKALREIYRVLKPGGVLLIRLPAYNWLRGQHDLIVHTARRYTVRSLTGRLCGSGFKVEYVSYVNMFLFPFAFLKRMMERMRLFPDRGSDLRAGTGLLNPLLQSILAFEARLLRSLRLPFGLSVIAAGRKVHVDE